MQWVIHANQNVIPEFFIFVSSEGLESEGGLERRIVSGRLHSDGGSMYTLILIDSAIRLYFRYNGPFPEKKPLISDFFFRFEINPSEEQLEWEMPVNTNVNFSQNSVS